MLTFKKSTTEKGKVIGIDRTTDPPWINARVFVECPDQTKISFYTQARNKSDLPKRGDEVPLKQGRFGFEVKEN